MVVLKRLKKFTAFFMAMIMMLLSLPPIQVFAHSQNPVGTMSIQGENTPGNNINFTWQRPILGQVDTNDVHWEDFGGHPQGYELFMRNASQGPFVFNHSMPWQEVPATPTSMTFNERFTLTPPAGTPGSIFAFQIIPWHNHGVRQYVDGNFAGYSWVRAPYAVPMAQHQQLLYMTDINVDVENVDGNMVVTWDNPRFDNNQVFPRYQITVRPMGSNTSSISVEANASNWIPVEGGARLQMTLPTNNLIMGMRYSVEVEPRGVTGVDFPTNVFIDGDALPISRATGRRYINNDFYLRPLLTVREEGTDFLRITWSNLVPQSPVQVSRIELWSSNDPAHFAGPVPSPEARLLLTVSQGMTSHMITPQPNERTYFFVIYHLLDGTTATMMTTNVEVFDPFYVWFRPYSPTIHNIEHFGTVSPSLGLDITWRAFTRAPFNALERGQTEFLPGVGNVFLDRNIEYMVWITDDVSLLADNRIGNMQPIAVLDAMGLNAERVLLDHDPIRQDIFYTYSFTHFTNAFGEVLPLEDNTIYYVRIVARRTETVDGRESISQPAFGSYYIPPYGNLALIPQMVPVRIKRDENGIEQITTDSFTIQWDLRWLEVYDDGSRTAPGAANTRNWHNVVGVRDGYLVFGREALSLYDNGPRYINLWDDRYAVEPLTNAIAMERVRQDLIALGANQDIGLLPIRFMDIRDVDYEIHTAEYHLMQQTGGYDAYFESLLGGGNWTNIVRGIPTPGTTNQFEHTVTTVHAPAGAVQPNTSYVTFFRPINAVGPAHFPTWVSATTLMEIPDLDITPTVPILRVVDVGDTWITVRWNGSHEFNYELFFSELLLDYPTGGGRIAISPEDIRENARVIGNELEFTITGLFPYTMHHMWIRTLNQQGRYSVWSNPVSARTLDIVAPLPPTAIRLASRTSLDAFNTENGTDLRVGYPTSLIIEWMRIHADLNNPAPATQRLPYTSTGGEATWLDSPSLPISYMAMFEELIANRRYYVRVRTWLTVTRGTEEQGGLQRSYSYEMQLSLSRDFLDPITIIIPGMADYVDNAREMRRLSSVWSDIQHFQTGRTDYEYDGNVNPDLFPLPDQDFEHIYVWPNTLVFRLRSNQVDQMGNADNQADQRFISRLVTNRVFSYEIDVSVWGNWPVQERVVEIPFGIIEAFNERQIDLVINAGNMVLTIPYDAIVTDAVRNLNGLDRNTRVLLTLSETNAVASDMAANLSSTPQVLTVEFIEGLNTVSVTEFLRPITVEMNFPQSHVVGQNNITGLINNSRSNGWRAIDTTVPLPDAQLDGVPNILPATPHRASFSTLQTGSFTVQSTPPAAVAGGATSQTVPAMQRVNSHLRITDLGTYNENATVHANQFNQIIAAVLTNQDTVAMNTPLSSATWTSLGRSGMLVTGEFVSREEGISSLVRVFEIQTGTPVVFMEGFSSMPDIGSATNQSRMLQAEALGFFRTGSVNPHEALTFGDLMFILDIILGAR